MRVVQTRPVREDVKIGVVQQPREFVVKGIHRLVHQRDACLSGLYCFAQKNLPTGFN
jgi:hypothetical protein